MFKKTKLQNVGNIVLLLVLLFLLILSSTYLILNHLLHHLKSLKMDGFSNIILVHILHALSFI